MPGLDSAIAALLASRTDMLLSALNTQTSSTAPQANNTSQLLVDTPRVATPASAVNAYAAPGPSAQTALSEIARTLDAISRFGGSATPALLGNMPLWPTAPRIVQAASAFESLSGSLFSSSSASAAGAVNPPAPPLPATVLAGMLARTVADSGLFYENHIALWLGGQRSLASLSNEPQARVDKSASGLPSGSFAQPAAAAAEVWIDETLLPPTFAADTANPMNAARPVPTPQTPQQAAALAASVREMPASVFSSAAPASSGASTGTQSSAAHVHDSAVQAALASGIHPSTIPLVRQQLDVLASDQFRWSGEAWPGAKFEWQIQPQNHGPQERDAHQDGGSIDAHRAWHTRVTLTLPTLGNVDADLVLTGNQLVVRMNASEGGAARLAADGDHFRQQIDAAGLQLAELTVRARDSLAQSPADPAFPHFADVASAAGLPAAVSAPTSTSIPPGRSTS